MANQELEVVSHEMTDIYKTLQNDMSSVMNYLA